MIDSTSSDLTWGALLDPLKRSPRLLIGIPVIAAAVTVGYSMLQPRKFAAELTLSTVASQRVNPLGQGLSAALLGNLSGGLQASPAFVNRLLTSTVVLSAVALKPAGDGNPLPVARRLKNLPADAQDYRLISALRDIVAVSLDRETGLVTVRLAHSDSGLARLATTRLIDQTSEAFRQASKAQARQLRVAQENRVDSLGRQLRNAQEELRRFRMANRVITTYSVASLEQMKLESDLSLAQNVYSQAMLDRESAVAKELEETPAVVIIDPIPRQLVPVSRGTAERAILAAFLAAVACVIFLFIRASRTAAERPVRPAVIRRDASAVGGA